jgi:acyl carrier protein
MIDLASQVRERLALLLEIDPGSIADESEFGDLGVDSMMRLELISLVEQHLGFEIPEGDLVQIQTISQVVDYARRGA